MQQIGCFGERTLCAGVVSVKHKSRQGSGGRGRTGVLHAVVVSLVTMRSRKDEVRVPISDFRWPIGEGAGGDMKLYFSISFD